jgi:hypothetical protein
MKRIEPGCLEPKGVTSYPSLDKAVLFFEVPDLTSAIAAIREEQLVHSEPPGPSCTTPRAQHTPVTEIAVSRLT